MTHYDVEHLDDASGMTADWWTRAVQGSRSEDAKDESISIGVRGADGYIDPSEIGSFEVEGGVARNVETGHALENYRALADAGLDPSENQGFIDTTGSGVDDRVELEEGSFEGDRALFLSEASSLDADTSQDLGTSAWEERLNPDGRGNNSEGATNPDPKSRDPDIDLNDWGHFDDPPVVGGDEGVGPAPGWSSDGARSRRGDGRQGSAIFGGDGGGGGSSGSGGVTTKQAVAGTAAVGGLGALAYLFLL